MSNLNLDKDRITIVTGFALFLFGIITNAVFALRFDEIDKEILFLTKFLLLTAILSLLIAVICGATIFLELTKYDMNKIEDSLLFTLCTAVTCIMGILVLLITESKVYLLIFGFCFGITMDYVWRRCRIK